ncbi:MAG TPA: AlkA N-terminal domain-containing protein [Polyangiaceae bacterium]|jgi:AraC family transcriptional regulator of adaptative response / DNA-3-methyladenine glycosylase II
MALDTDGMYRAMVSRDRRFEGQFVVGVRTTGIYCRPGCPARTPHRRNVHFYTCAAAAQADGLRPCLRCRPDASPGTPAALGTPATVSRALRLIDEGALDEAGVDELAERLGVTARHLRRLFDQHLGASPLAVARTKRVHFARKLLDETELPMTEVAHAAGFASLRRFNDAVREAFHATPSDLRRRSPGVLEVGVRPGLLLRLPYREPLAYAELLGFLAARAIPGVERVDGGTYARTITFAGGSGAIEVSRAGDARHLLLAVRAARGTDLFAVAARVRRLFDLDADPHRIDAHLARDRRLARAVRARPGLRVPGAWDGFEIAVRAILGQQVSVAGATTLAGRLVDRFGVRVPGGGGGLTHLFPTPAALVAADVASIGLPRARAEAIRGLARAVEAGARPFDAVERLTRLEGIGDWTAAYVAMRAGRDPDAFPAGDLGLRRALATRRGALPSARALETISGAWRPWRAYAAMHLWTMGATR